MFTNAANNRVQEGAYWYVFGDIVKIDYQDGFGHVVILGVDRGYGFDETGTSGIRLYPFLDEEAQSLRIGQYIAVHCKVTSTSPPMVEMSCPDDPRQEPDVPLPPKADEVELSPNMTTGELFYDPPYDKRVRVFGKVVRVSKNLVDLELDRDIELKMQLSVINSETPEYMKMREEYIDTFGEPHGHPRGTFDCRVRTFRGGYLLLSDCIFIAD